MKSKKAFTLIEVMVVLSMLAIIAILAYSFFGNVVKDATTTRQAIKIMGDLQLMSDAYETYLIDNGQRPPRTTGFYADFTTMPDWLKERLKSLPSPPEASAYQTGCSSSPVFQYHLVVDDWSTSGTVSAANDTYVAGVCVNDLICMKINELYTTLGNTINTTTPCPKWGRCCMTSAGTNWATMIVENN